MSETFWVAVAVALIGAIASVVNVWISSKNAGKITKVQTAVNGNSDWLRKKVDDLTERNTALEDRINHDR